MRIRQTLIPLLIIFFAAGLHPGGGRYCPAGPGADIATRSPGKPSSKCCSTIPSFPTCIGQRFKSKADLPPRFGGRDLLFALDRLAERMRGCGRRSCHQSSYETADIRNVAQESWWTVGVRGAKVIDVSESVVALPHGGSRRCAVRELHPGLEPLQRHDGHVTLPERWRSNGRTITDVRAANSVLAATVDAAGSTFTITSARAVGVRVNCLVEVNVAFFADRPGGTAVDIAHQMMDKISRRADR